MQHGDQSSGHGCSSGVAQPRCQGLLRAYQHGTRTIFQQMRRFSVKVEEKDGAEQQGFAPRTQREILRGSLTKV
jgi:hypothetical protein